MVAQFSVLFSTLLTGQPSQSSWPSHACRFPTGEPRMRTGANTVTVSVTIARQLRMRTVSNPGTASVLVARIRVSSCSLTWRLIRPKKDMLHGRSTPVSQVLLFCNVIYSTPETCRSRFLIVDLSTCAVMTASGSLPESSNASTIARHRSDPHSSMLLTTLRYLRSWSKSHRANRCKNHMV